MRASLLFTASLCFLIPVIGIAMGVVIACVGMTRMACGGFSIAGMIHKGAFWVNVACRAY